MGGRIRLGVLVPCLLVALALGAALVVGAVSYVNSRDHMVEQAEGKLSALLDARKSELSSYLDAISEDVTLLAEGHAIRDVLTEFDTAFRGLDGNPKALLQKSYIEDNPNPLGSKQLLDRAQDGTVYSVIHGKYHGWLRNYADKRGYYDIFLINNNGDVVYTVFKEADFATNLLRGDWKDSDLGVAFRELQQTGKTLVFKDFRAYAPSHGAPAAFIMAPVKDLNGSIMGAVAFQMPIQRINKVMQVEAGMGETGETYIVGPDRLMRSDSRFSKDSTILSTKVDTETVAQALDGAKGVEAAADYRGMPVFSAFAPLDFLGIRWAIMAEMDEAEVLAPVKQNGMFMLAVGVVVGLAVAAIGIFIARRITGPIGGMTRTMEVLAGGQLDVDVPGLQREDEIGQMAKAVQVFKQNAIEVKRLEEEQHLQKERAEAQRKETMRQMADSFQQAVGDVIETVSSAATELQASAQQMSSSAQETSAQAAAVAAAAEQASANVQTVASATEELTSSISEIGGQVERSTEVSTQAVTTATATRDAIERLSANVDKIGEVVSLINDISAQTNLLALNATIEAARAGEAGKGFAVVAAEVKGLANQTGRATDEIASQIAEIQTGTGEAVAAIRQVADIITQMNEISSAVASAVQEQGAATQEIARNVEQAAGGTQEVTSNIVTVGQAAQDTGSAAGQIESSSRELSTQAEFLRSEVRKFLENVRR